MNHFKYVSTRSLSCQLKRFQSSVTQIQIPPRIERGPTDILTALASTVPKDKIQSDYIFHDDPYLYPMKKQYHRIYTLSYESGKKTAMWVHKEHRNLFPKHLSEPLIQAFKPLRPCTKKNASEESLLEAISEYRLSDAICIYELIETKVSNTTKQALLELWCFYSNNKIGSKEFPNEQWYTKPFAPFWQHNTLIQQLYEFLIVQDTETAALAYNTMLCGLAKFSRNDECWLLYKKMEEQNIPLNLTSYNYLITMLSHMSSKGNNASIDTIYDILRSMNKNRIKPNVITLNAVLRKVSKLPESNAEVHSRIICKEFIKLNIKFSLASYLYLMNIIVLKGSQSYNEFMDIIHLVSKENLVLQDPNDVKFFPQAMYMAFSVYGDRKAADMIHKVLTTGDNYKFISNNTFENTYYSSYLLLLISTSTIPEFFKIYETLVPNVYLPTINIISKILKELSFHQRENIANYVSRIWSDIIMLGYVDTTLKLNAISLMNTTNLPADSPLRSVFVDAALDCWDHIQFEILNKPESYNPIGTAMLGSIVLMLLHNDYIDKSVEVLTYITKETHMLVPTMTSNDLNELFETCISKECIKGALLIIQYGINFGFPEATKMANKLQDLPQLTDTERNQLIKLQETSK